ncbi:MAG: glycosyltransferase [Streptococcaceae bacterium]|jgi:glycosyltransferase involved in cell wall biosynthesis|nr:glycosyltransferase [Streptococcaceae bacterium]
MTDISLNKPLISIIVPVYNVLQFIEVNLTSILSQDYQNFELLLIDDGSTDGTDKILDCFAQQDSRVHVLKQQNHGVSHARNAGLKIAKGSYIAFIDADDEVEPNYLSYLYGLSRKYNTPLVMTNNTYLKKGDRQDKTSEMVISGEQAAFEMLYYRLPIGVYTKLYRRDLIESVQPFLEDLLIGEDFYFNLSVLLRTDHIVVSSAALYQRRLNNPESILSTFDVAKWESGLEAVSRIKRQLLPQNNDKLFQAWEYAWWHTNGDFYKSLVIHDQTTIYPEITKRVLKNIKSLSLKQMIGCSIWRQKLKILLWLISPSIPSRIAIYNRKKKFKTKNDFE